MKIIYQLSAIGLLFASCSNFLDEKPDAKMVIPSSLTDAQLLLNDYNTLNAGYPVIGEIGTDDYYVTEESWNAASNMDQRNAYIWHDLSYVDAVQWQRPYKTVYIANQVLDVLDKISPQDDLETYSRSKGGAHFFRAFALHLLTELHCSAYDVHTASTQLGLPLRLSPAVDDVSKRATLQETYGQLLSDFKIAASYLPVNEAIKGRPSKAAAYAGLSRVYLDMGDYESAFLYADSCLLLNPQLLDYNALKAGDALPLPKFNIEVLFPALSSGLLLMGANTALIDSDLYNSYTHGDLRKSIFFKANNVPANSFLFKGSYDKSLASMFVGITNSEVYLIKSEAACRLNKTTESLSALNELRKNRWDKNVPFLGIVETDPMKLLPVILQERRKELVFRGRRWADLKRLNLDDRFKKTISRKLGSQTYELEPNSLKYAFKIPESVINLSGIPQNNR